MQFIHNGLCRRGATLTAMLSSECGTDPLLTLGRCQGLHVVGHMMPMHDSQCCSPSMAC